MQKLGKQQRKEKWGLGKEQGHLGNLRQPYWDPGELNLTPGPEVPHPVVYNGVKMAEVCKK